MYKEHRIDQADELFSGIDHVEKEFKEDTFLIKHFEDLNWKDPFPPPKIVQP